jgi:hypothetical protein
LHAGGLGGGATVLLEHLWGKGVDWCGKGVDQGLSAMLKWPTTCLMANNVPSSGQQRAIKVAIKVATVAVSG